MAQGANLPPKSSPTFQTSTLSEDERAEATAILHYLLRHAHHIVNENGCTFHGNVVCFQGVEIMVHIKVDFPPTKEFLETENYTKMVQLNLWGDYHSQLIYHVMDVIIYVTPVVPSHRYIKHTCCTFSSGIWAHQYHNHPLQEPTYHVQYRKDVTPWIILFFWT